MTRSRWVAATALIGVIVAAACGASPNRTTPTASSSVPGAPSSSLGSTGTESSPAVQIDPGLLGMLPKQVDGLALLESPDAEADAVDDPVVPAVGTAIAGAFAADPDSGEFVYVLVVALRPGVMNDAVFRSWRDTFDEGACSQAGGVTGHAEAEIAGRQTYIGTCAGGLHTYHVWLRSTNRLVSISALGERRLGERVLEEMTP